MDQQISPYVEVLATLVERSGVTKVNLEQRLGWSRGTLTKVLKERHKLTVVHVLKILEVLDIEPLSYYKLVHGSEPAQGTSWESAFRMLGPAARPLVLSRFLAEEDLDRLIAEAVEKAMMHREKDR
jgi:transcriptional regulator with XRE-family HTH domain